VAAIFWPAVSVPMKDPATPVPMKAMLARPKAVRTAKVRSFIFSLVSIGPGFEAPVDDKPRR